MCQSWTSTSASGTGERLQEEAKKDGEEITLPSTLAAAYGRAPDNHSSCVPSIDCHSRCLPVPRF